MGGFFCAFTPGWLVLSGVFFNKRTTLILTLQW